MFIRITLSKDMTLLLQVICTLPLCQVYSKQKPPRNRIEGGIESFDYATSSAIGFEIRLAITSFLFA